MAKKYNNVKPVKTVEAEEVTEVTTEKKTLEKVVAVQPQKVKRNLVSRLFNGVMGPDGVSGIGEYVNDEIIKPAIKNIIVEAVTSGINMIMYGERGGRGTYRGGSGTGHSRNYQGGGYQRTNYTSRYTQHNPAPEPREVSRRYGVEEYLINSREDAAHVIVQLTENAEVYGNVSVADYYDLIGVASVYTDNQYGWTYDAIIHSTIAPVRGGYIIKFPQVEVL